jgi:hypothetical protein
MRAVLFISVGAAFLSGIVGRAEAQSATITFDNRSGEPASIKLIGPTKPTAEVPNGQFRTVSVAYGHYYFMIRYGSGQYQYIYAKSDAFQVMETPTQHEVFICYTSSRANPWIGICGYSAASGVLCEN